MAVLVLTHCTPVAALAVSWDAMVSVLRCDTPEELLEMAHHTNAEHYVWKAGSYRRYGVPVTFWWAIPGNHCDEVRDGRMMSACL